VICPLELIHELSALAWRGTLVSGNEPESDRSRSGADDETTRCVVEGDGKEDQLVVGGGDHRGDGADDEAVAHRRMVREAIGSALPKPRKKPERPRWKLKPAVEFIDAILQGDRNLADGIAHSFGFRATRYVRCGRAFVRDAFTEHPDNVVAILDFEIFPSAKPVFGFSFLEIF
jgi:hypothetical protein